MVVALRPASCATSTKAAPSVLFGFSATWAAATSPAFGRMSARISCSERTSAERLRDFKNARREEDKGNDTFSRLDRATIRRYFYSERLPAFASRATALTNANHRFPLAKQANPGSAIAAACILSDRQS